MTMIDHLKNGLRPTDQESISWLVEQGYLEEGHLTQEGYRWAVENEIPVVDHTTLLTISPLFSSRGTRYPAGTEVVVLWVSKKSICDVVFPDGGLGCVYDITRRRQSHKLIRPHLEA